MSRKGPMKKKVDLMKKVNLLALSYIRKTWPSNYFHSGSSLCKKSNFKPFLNEMIKYEKWQEFQ